MKTEFTPIAMRCTKEQFKAIEPKLKGIEISVWGLKKHPYLCNNWNDDDSLKVGNCDGTHSTLKTVSKIYETWDEATFLKACGIEVDTTPTLEEVKEYFKNAKKVRCANRKKDIGTVELNKFKFSEKGNAVIQNPFKKNWLVLWDSEKGYAEIISYKDTYTVSKDFILEAHESACSTLKTEIENQFPELFPKVEPVTGWFKQKQSYGYWLGYYENDELKYVITDDGFKTFEIKSVRNSSDCREEEPATKEEVEIALIAELDKKLKGKTFREVKFIDPTTKNAFKIEGNFRYFNDNGDWCHLGNVILSKDGKWAEIISEPIEISLDEIAEKFGVDVSLIKIKK